MKLHLFILSFLVSIGIAQAQVITEEEFIAKVILQGVSVKNITPDTHPRFTPLEWLQSGSPLFNTAADLIKLGVPEDSVYEMYANLDSDDSKKEWDKSAAVFGSKRGLPSLKKRKERTTIGKPVFDNDQNYAVIKRSFYAGIGGLGGGATEVYKREAGEWRKLGEYDRYTTD